MRAADPELAREVRRAIALDQVVGRDDRERVAYWLDRYGARSGIQAPLEVARTHPEPVALVPQAVADRPPSEPVNAGADPQA